ncbi:MAG TPA: CARDB domain-containing protein, partial [Planctomycetaceae bacterium]|nr:CARDB domain-containing protein [Planctomycetaceae bacterium]
ATAGSLRVEANSRERFVEQLHELKTTGGSSDLLAALFTAVHAETQPTLSRRRIVLVSDGQSADWMLDDRASWERFHDTLKTVAVPTDLEIVELSGESVQQSNLAVQDVRSSRVSVGVDQMLMFSAQIVNHGNSTLTPRSVTWTIGDQMMLQSDVPALEGGATRDVYWRHSFSEPGSYAITCRVDADDELQADNDVTTIIEVVERIPVLLTESRPDLAEMQRDAFFVQAALGWIDGQPLEERSVHAPRSIDPDELSFIDLSDQHAVVIPNFQSLSQEAVERLQQFVYDGGGLWIALGPRTDAEAFNQFLFAEGNGLAPLELDRIREQANEEEGLSGTRINPFQKEHPATSHLTDSQKLDTGDVTVTRRWRFVPPPEGEATSVLLSLTDGEPLAVEKYHGRGRVIVQAIPLRMQWSDLARSQAFVVMTQEWLSYLTQPKAVQRNLSPGDPIVIEQPDEGLRNAILNTPQGDEIELTADVRGDRVVFQSGRTALPGEYTLELGTSGEKIPFYVRRNIAESDLTPLSAQDRELFSGLTGLRQGRTKAGFHGTTQSEPVWPMLLILLTGLIAAELILSGIIARERFGSEPIAESSEQSGAFANPFASEPSEPKQRQSSIQPAEEQVGASR